MSGCIQSEVLPDGVGLITVSNPDKFNAMSLSMWKALKDHVKHFEGNAQVRVLVLTGQGDRAFVSGADISEFACIRSGSASVSAYDEAVQDAQSTLNQCEKPTVARIRGVCMGGGIGLAMACDLRYASSDARFRMPAARIGLGYARNGMEQLLDTLGATAAMDIFLTARVFDGREAERMGLVHECFDDALFNEKINLRIEAVATNAPLTLRAAKATIRDILRPQGEERRKTIDHWIRDCFESSDYREGQVAFRERRVPQFKGI